MVEMFARLTEVDLWARFWNSFFYTSIAFALAQNKLILTNSSQECQGLIKTMECKNFSPKSRLNKDDENTLCFVLSKQGSKDGISLTN